MNNFFAIALSLGAGLLLGSVNWYLLYKLYGNMLAFGNKGKLTRKDKISLALTALFKVLVLFAGLYLVIVVFRFNVLYLLLGLVTSLICMIILLIRMNR